MNRKTVLLACLLCVFLCASAFCEEARPVVRVGEITYDAKQVQTALDELMAINEASGITLTEAECAEAAENTIENYVIRGLAENRIRELGLDHLSKDIDYSLQAQAQQAYEQAWQQVRGQYSEDELTDEQITRLLEAAGVTNERCYRDAALGYEISLLLEHYGVSVELGDAEIDAFYLENYVALYETRYAEDIPLYEREVLFGESDSLYVPQGYRKITQILLPFPEEIRTGLESLSARADELYETAQAAYDEVAALAVEGKDIESARQRYAEAKAELDQLEVEEGRLRANILPAVQGTVDEIYARLRAGESFADISKLYGETAEELPYHPDSEAWTEEFAQAMGTLSAPGDVSQPAVCADGVHIFCYAEDIPGGAVQLIAAAIPAVAFAGASHDALKKLREMRYIEQLCAVNANAPDWHEGMSLQHANSLQMETALRTLLEKEILPILDYLEQTAVAQITVNDTEELREELWQARNECRAIRDEVKRRWTSSNMSASPFLQVWKVFSAAAI